MSDIKDMDAQALQAELASIEERAAAVDLTDTEAAEQEIAALEKRKAAATARLEELKAEAAKDAEKRAEIAAGAGETVKDFKEEERKTMTINNVEYRNAWLKAVAKRPLDEAEERVLTTGLTVDQSVLVPTEVQNNIWDLVYGQHAILADIQTLRANCVVDIPVHTASSGASSPDEGTAPDEETNTFAKITLSGVDYAKYVELSYAMRAMAIPALESYIETEIAKAIGELMAEDAVSNIEGAINAENQFAGITYANIAAAFGSLKRASGVVIYATRATIYGSLIGMVDDNGNPIFQQPAAGAPLGAIWGAPIKVEDAVGDDALLIGDPSKAVNAVVQDILIESDTDIKTHNVVISGYARAEAALVDDKGFALVSAEAAA